MSAWIAETVVTCVFDVEGVPYWTGIVVDDFHCVCGVTSVDHC